MGKSAGKISRRIMAAVLTVSMVMPSMAVYASNPDMTKEETQAGAYAAADDMAAEATESAEAAKEGAVTAKEDTGVDDAQGDLEAGDVSDEGTGENASEVNNGDEEKNIDNPLEAPDGDADEDVLPEEEGEGQSAAEELFSGEVTEKTYIFNPETDLEYVETNSLKDILPGSMVGTDAYFKLDTLGNSDGYVRNEGTYVRIKEEGKGGIQFSIEGTATVVVEAASTGSSNTSDVVLRNKSGEDIAEKDGKKSVYGSAKNALTYEGVPAGTYTVISPNIENKRDARIHSITVKETSGRERVDLSLLTPPEIKALTQVEGDTKLSVDVAKAPVGYEGGDRLLVVLEDEQGNVIEGIEGISIIGSSEHTIIIDISGCGSGKYTARAKLIRGTGSEQKELSGTVTKSIDYVSVLKAPTELQVTNKGKVTDSNPVSGSAALSWGAVSGAEYYVIKVIDAETNTECINTRTNGAETNILIDSGLAIGKKYTFMVYAARQLNGAEELSETAAVEESYEIIEGEGDALFPEGKYVLQVSRDVGIFGSSTKQDGDIEKAGDGRFFTLIYSNASKVEDKEQTFDDGIQETRKINFGGEANIAKNSIMFITSAAAKVKVYWQAGSDNREMRILNAEGSEITATNLGVANNTLSVSNLYLSEAGKYYLGGKGGNNSIFRVEVDNGYVRDRIEWSQVPNPEIISVAKDAQGLGIDITVKAKIGAEGANGEADKVEVTMYDENGNVAGSAETAAESVNPVLNIVPKASGKYRFRAALFRDDEEEAKYSRYPEAEAEFYEFVISLSQPKFTNVQSKGAVDESRQYGSAELIWEPVSEADRYVVTVKGKDTEYKGESPISVENSESVLIDKGLEVGKTYIFGVSAQRDSTGEVDAEGNLIKPEMTDEDTAEVKIEAEYNSKWKFVVYGIGTTTKSSGFVAADGTKATDNNYTNEAGSKIEYSAGYGIKDTDGTIKETITPSVNADAGDFVRVWSWDGKGKIVPKDTDGLAFYYTEINPQTTNFKLSANLHVNRWNLTNGQEGFGILAADRIGKDGNSEYHWTNSYTAVASKVDYYWDSVNGKVSKDEGTKISLKLGIGTTAKTGVTAENLPVFENDVTSAVQSWYNSETLPLDTSVRSNIYDNIIANGISTATKDVPELIEDFKLGIELNATGYFVSYTPLVKNADGTFSDGTTVTQKYYDRDALSKIKKNTVYVGFFTSRYADITFRNVRFDTRRYDPDEAVETRPVDEVKLKASVSSSKTANNADYKLVYNANWKGKVTVRDESGAVIKTDEIVGSPEEDGSVTVDVKLNVGENKFQVTFDPDLNYDPYNGSPYARLTSYDAKVETVSITWKKYGADGNVLYVSPKGTASGDGTKVNPLDIYTAVKYVQPGQTIYLMGGIYNLTSTIKVNRGVDGTKDKMIYMLADPETCVGGVRPVFDFNGVCPGMVFAGNYWYCSGFDVTKSANQAKGIQVSGNNNVLDGLCIYKNGSTGLQISRLLTSDKTIEDWPANNLILNCTSYLNSDAGYEDADGFAAKLTVGQGNVFQGCVAAFNADDGWDLFAKVETGPIGDVVIRDSIAYRNGYLLRNADTGEPAWYGEAQNIEEIDAGNGNGFKLGGSSISGRHRVENSVSFYNKSKGIDSNSGPDIQVKDSISFNNESFNIAMYSNAAKTDYGANGVISYKNNSNLYDIEDRIGLKSNNAASSLVNTQADCVTKVFNNTNFFWNKLSCVSESGSNFYKNYATWTDKSKNPGKPSIYVKDSWFKSLDYDKWFKENCSTIHSASRNADGTINLHGFLELTEEGKQAMAAAGAEGETGLGSGQGSKDAKDFLDKITGETNGSIDIGNAGGEIEESANSQDLTQMPGDVIEGDLWIAIVERDEIEYTGKALKPEIHVYSGKNTLLKAGRDYTVTYKNNLNAYVGAYADNALYSGNSYYEKNAGFYDKYNGVSVTELLDYYSQGNRKKPTIIVKGKGNYTKQAKEVYFDINPVSISDDEMNRIGTADVALVSNNGRALKVNPTLTFNNKKLSCSSDKDFAFEIYQNIENEAGNTEKKPLGDSVSAAGLYELSIAGKNNFAGIKNVNLTVIDSNDKDMLASGFNLAQKIPDKYREGYNPVAADEEKPLPVTLSATGNNPELVVKDKKGNVLVADKHYKVSYKNNINIGTATVIVTGLAYEDENGSVKAYAGSKEFKFRIVAPNLSVMLRSGNAKFVDTAELKYEKESETGMFLITDESSMKAFGDTRTYQYEGKGIDPVNDDNLGLAVKRGDSWYLLKQDRDYKLTYRNNSKKGNAAAVFKGIGNYSGSVNQKFQVSVFDLGKLENLKKLGGTFALNASEGDNAAPTPVMFKELKQDKGAYVYQGFTAEVSYDKGGVKPTVSLRINGNLLKAGKDYTISYRNNTKVTADNTPVNKQPTIIIKGKNGLSGTISGTYTISKKSLDDSENKIKIVVQDVKISKQTQNGYTGSYKSRIAVKDAKGKTLSAGSDYDKNIEYELVDNKSYETIKKLTDKELVTIEKNNADQFLTIKATVKPNSASQYYKGNEEGISAYYRVLYTKNSIRSAKATVKYSAASTNGYEAGASYFYYNEAGINLNKDLLEVKLGNEILEWGEDFEVVKYVGADRRGTAKLVIQGKGKYYDTKTITFNIKAKEFKWWEK